MKIKQKWLSVSSMTTCFAALLVHVFLEKTWNRAGPVKKDQVGDHVFRSFVDGHVGYITTSQHIALQALFIIALICAGFGIWTYKLAPQDSKKVNSTNIDGIVILYLIGALAAVAGLIASWSMYGTTIKAPVIFANMGSGIFLICAAVATRFPTPMGLKLEQSSVFAAMVLPTAIFTLLSYRNGSLNFRAALFLGASISVGLVWSFWVRSVRLRAQSKRAKID